jgi:hypothetical protein
VCRLKIFNLSTTASHIAGDDGNLRSLIQVRQLLKYNALIVATISLMEENENISFTTKKPII